MMYESSLRAEIETHDKTILDWIEKLRGSMTDLEKDIRAGRRTHNRLPTVEASGHITALVSTREVLLSYRMDPLE
jgi:hypothetical protein